MIHFSRGKTYLSLHIHALKLQLHIMIWKRRFWEHTFKIETDSDGDRFLNAGIAYISLTRSSS